MRTREAATASYYEILGVEPASSHDQIKQAFLELSLRFRREQAADGSPQAVERATFRLHEVNEAWAVLRNPAARARYDDERRAQAGASAVPSRRSPVSPPGGSDDDLPVLEVLDVIDDGRPPRPAPRSAGGGSRRWRLFNSALTLLAAVVLVGVTASVGGRGAHATTRVRAWPAVSVGSCIVVGESAGAPAVEPVPCGGPGSMRVVARTATTQACPRGSRAMVVTGGPENICTA